MKVPDKKLIQSIDRITSDVFKIPPLILMENAGIAICSKIIELFPSISSPAIIIGPGNNGGDGFVIARWLFTRGFSPALYIFCNQDRLKDDSLINFTSSQKLNIKTFFINNYNDWNLHKDKLFSHDSIIDALLGTGIFHPLKPFYASVINDINSCFNKTIFAVDTPSGLIHTNDNNPPSQIAIKATHTITIELPKIGMFLNDYPKEDFVGQLHIVNIGFPPILITDTSIPGNLITETLIRRIIPNRPHNAHKGIFGHVLVIGGSRQFLGAPILSCIAALKSGCGLVSLASIPSICNNFCNSFPEGMPIPLEENDDGFISASAKNILSERLASFSSIVFGPGLGISYDNFELISFILTNYSGKCIIDADGINVISKWADDITDLFNNSQADIVITPHIKEFQRLTKLESSHIIANKLALIPDIANKYNINILLKGTNSTIFSHDKSFYFNTTGNEGMACAGSGDVLSGIIGSFMAQGLSALDSSILGAYIHGLAGDKACAFQTNYSMTPSSIINHLNDAFKTLLL